jgi:hypothetical protein
MMAYKSAGVKLPRTTGMMINSGTSVSKADLLPGDLVFPDPGHVQIYLGNGEIVEAPRSGLKVRRVKMWGFWRARRVSAPGSAVGSGDADNAGFSIPNPLDDVNDFIDAIKGFGKAAAWLSDPHNWLRIAMAYVGFILIVIALFGALRNPAKGAIKGATKLAKGVTKGAT